MDFWRLEAKWICFKRKSARVRCNICCSHVQVCRCGNCYRNGHTQRYKVIPTRRALNTNTNVGSPSPPTCAHQMGSLLSRLQQNKQNSPPSSSLPKSYSPKSDQQFVLFPCMLFIDELFSCQFHSFHP